MLVYYKNRSSGNSSEKLLQFSSTSGFQLLSFHAHKISERAESVFSSLCVRKITGIDYYTKQQITQRY